MAGITAEVIRTRDAFGGRSGVNHFVNRNLDTRFGGLALVSFGGNAFDNTPGKKLALAEQFGVAKKSLGPVVRLLEQGQLALLTHGNGPQVGELQKLTGASLVNCGRLSQVIIGQMIEDGLRANMDKNLASRIKTVVVPTEILVDQADREFNAPTKPVGAYLAEEAYHKAQIEHPDWKFKFFPEREETSHDPYRRVVPSPLPQRIIQLDEIIYYLTMGYVVISCGGGGVPVIETGHDLYGNLDIAGTDAVIDKDYASALLAQSLIEAGMVVGDEGAERPFTDFIIATEVDRVALHFKQPNETRLAHLYLAEARYYLEQGEFPDGSMGPKVRAAAMAAGYGLGAYIVGLNNLGDLASGTKVYDPSRLTGTPEGRFDLKYWADYGRASNKNQ